MQIETLAVRLRARTPLEAVDLGAALCRHAARSVFGCYAIVALPIVALAFASYDIAAWLPSLAIWGAKPWLDRTILFVLSRAAFGQATTPADVWRSQREVWWRQLIFTWTLRRLTPWRSLTDPVYRLEGGSILGSSARVRQIRRRVAGSAFMMTSAFSVAELTLTLAAGSLVFWFAPAGRTPDISALVTGDQASLLWLTLPTAYAAAVLFLEPFFVAAGFAMYLNRRAELEAWDIEQEFRRAFAA